MTVPIIKVDDLRSGDVIKLLEEHLQDMYATSPPESVHALNVDGLKQPEITFYSCWKGEVLLGCAAIKALNNKHVELKSMRTSTQARNQGIASKLLHHVIEVAKKRGYLNISLETGSQDFFLPARQLYEKFGFHYCEPFGDYSLDVNSQFMTRKLTI